MLDARSIALHHTRAITPIGHEDVYFAFASGSLAYNCQECNAQCCRGHGYLVALGKELNAGLGSRPALKFFIEQGTAGAHPYHVTNCPPACFFLDRNGLCGIHVEHGPEAKPETCRLFPFNYFRRVGRYLIVCPHSGLCPLKIVSARGTSTESEYSHLLDAMTSAGIQAEVPECTIEGGVEVERVVALEREIVGLSESLADGARYREFFLAQVSTTSRIIGCEGVQAQAGVADVTKFLTAVCQVLGIETGSADPEDRSLARATMAMTPVLRSWHVFRKTTGPDAQVRISLDRVAHAMFVTHVIAALARSAGMEQITYQTIAKLSRDFEPLVYLLAHADCDMKWLPGIMLDLSLPQTGEFGAAYLKLAKALLPSVQERHPRALGVIVADACGPGDSVERITFLKSVARRLYGKLVMVGAAPSSRRRRLSPRPVLQRLALRYLNDANAMAVAKQISGVPPS